MSGTRHRRTTRRQRATEISRSLHVAGVKHRRVPRVVLLRRFEVVARKRQVAGKNTYGGATAHEHLAERHHVVVVDRYWSRTARQQDRLTLLSRISKSTDVVVVDVDVAAVDEDPADCTRLRCFDPAMIDLDVVGGIRRGGFRFVPCLNHRAGVGDTIRLPHVEARETPVIGVIARS